MHCNTYYPIICCNVLYCGCNSVLSNDHSIQFSSTFSKFLYYTSYDLIRLHTLWMYYICCHPDANQTYSHKFWYYLSLSVNVTCLWYVDCFLLVVHFVHFPTHSVHVNCNLNKMSLFSVRDTFTCSYRDLRQQTPPNIYTDTKWQGITSQKTVILLFTWVADTGVTSKFQFLG